MYHRVFLFSFSDYEEALKFIELLSEHLKGANIIVDFKGTTVRVRIYGSRSDIESTFLKIKDLVAIVKGESKGGLRKYPLRYILTNANLKAPIPVNLIQDVLVLRGFKAEIKRGHIVTDASLKEVQRILETISEIYLKLREVKASPRAKKVIALLATLTGSSIEESLKMLIDEGIIRTVEKTKAYVITCKYEAAIEAVRKLLNRTNL